MSGLMTGNVPDRPTSQVLPNHQTLGTKNLCQMNSKNTSTGCRAMPHINLLSRVNPEKLWSTLDTCIVMAAHQNSDDSDGPVHSFMWSLRSTVFL